MPSAKWQPFCLGEDELKRDKNKMLQNIENNLFQLDSIGVFQSKSATKVYCELRLSSYDVY